MQASEQPKGRGWTAGDRRSKRGLSRRAILARLATLLGGLGVPRLARAHPPRDGAALRRELGRLERRGLGVILPNNPNYDVARLVYDRRVDKRPLAILECASTDHVQAALRWAVQSKLPFTVRSGGHGFTGRSTIDRGLLLDLSQMDEVQLDQARRVVRVGPGARTAHVLGVTLPARLAPVTCSDGHVGVVGAALFAGQGFLSPQHGNMCDNVESLEMVLASGELISVSAESHPELFWAMRGAGDNFGIVTSMTMRVHDVPAQVQACNFVYDATQGAEIMRRFRDYAWASPLPWVLGSVFLDPASGQPRLSYLFALTGNDAQSQRDLDAIGQFGAPLSRSVRAMDWIELHAQLGLPPDNRFHIAQKELPAFDNEAIALLMTELQRLAADPRRPEPIGESPGAMILFYATDAAMGRMAEPANAYTLRGGYDLEAIAIWSDASRDEHHVGWAEGVIERMFRAGKASKPSVLANSIVDARLTRASFGADYERLVALKRIYDPSGLFGTTAMITA